MKKIFEDINRWFYDMTRVFCNEWKLVGKDIGVMLFFVALPLMYPITYTLIYNPGYKHCRLCRRHGGGTTMDGRGQSLCHNTHTV